MFQSIILGNIIEIEFASNLYHYYFRFLYSVKKYIEISTLGQDGITGNRLMPLFKTTKYGMVYKILDV